MLHRKISEQARNKSKFRWFKIFIALSYETFISKDFKVVHHLLFSVDTFSAFVQVKTKQILN